MKKLSKSQKIFILIISFVVDFFPTTVSYQFFKNGQILLNHGSFFQEKKSLEDDRYQFPK